MKIIVQRVKDASVHVEGKSVCSMEKHGLLIYFAVRKGDNEKNADFLAEKAAGLRIFEDEKGKMNLSVKDVDGAILIVPEFTLYGDCSKGKRPGFDLSAPPIEAGRLFEYFADKIKTFHKNVFTGIFRSHMHVHSTNDGPVTFIIEHPLNQKTENR
ncbi:MAG: D-tyrosyl-tRNA(Tyr) deacylase [Candidatus Aureabacteria bacterium]|nr:D-tyrosyl-tRNA(Tyr) deacylase [Candidatus Auribacterota bacterium]